jgi:tRNA pseudouridine55 synthase
MDGVLNVNKPRHVTSHDVVEKARRIIKEKRIGHTGTLDPIATGVLVLCVGKATRIARYLEAGEKEYQAIMRLGVTTDTLDADGRVLLSRTYMPPDKEAIKKAMRQFIGSIMQQPPAYSALKVAGVPSYKLAREGKAKPFSPRPIFIRNIELTSYEDPFVEFTVVCSKGVYVRSLCADLGEVLGMGAHLTGLIRTRSGRFTIQQAVMLDQLANLETSAEREKVLIPISEALAEFPAVSLSEKEAGRVMHGNHISCPPALIKSSGLLRLQDPDGNILALARNVAGVLKPELVFS